ncbi:hypothetical protein PBY51_015492 [Eleginops maclovinus]|uniref:Ninein-like protein n=1 Tax=Eleginops maclovinus TaxID=56733 RepID=A0AAN7X4G7_ELEMC|nr:hypothetical protein PBY51_015492 [Eleginops maclovinus]
MEHSDYVSQLKLEFDSCDSTSSGFLDRDDLTELCRKLRLDTHLPLLLHTLLGERPYARVNFEEFKEGFVAVLSRSLDFSTSEEDSSYLQPVVPEEVKPKLVKGSKRYGRRSRPDSSFSAEPSQEESPPSGPEEEDSALGVRRAKLRRSTSLESVESLKSDEEAGSQKENDLADFQSKGVQQEEVEPGGGGGGANSAEVDVLLRKLDGDLDVRDFQKVLRGSAHFACSTPLRSADLQRTPYGSDSHILPQHS